MHLASLVGWIGNVLILAGFWRMGDMKRDGFILYTIGEVIWVGYAIYIHMYDLVFVCSVFTIIAIRNMLKWRKE